MPHFRCVACGTRLHSAGSPTELVGGRCARCGAMLEAVGELSELVGYRSISPRAGATGPHGRIAGGVRELIARRDALVAQARVDAERWVDDGGTLRAQAVALPPPQAD